MDQVRQPKAFDTTYPELTREVGAKASPVAARRNRKRKAPESDKVTTNDESATNDENKIVGVKRDGEMALSNPLT